MTALRQLWSWVFAAIAALVFLIGMLAWERGGIMKKEGSAPPDDPMANMWNHAPIMEFHMRQNQTPWPQLEGAELKDLVTYLRAVREDPRQNLPSVTSDVQRGRDIFINKGCIKCHAIEGRGGTIGPDLSRPRTATDR